MVDWRSDSSSHFNNSHLNGANSLISASCIISSLFTTSSTPINPICLYCKAAPTNDSQYLHCISKKNKKHCRTCQFKEECR